MAQNNNESDELSRQHSTKELEANNNQVNSESNMDEGEEGGQSGKKVGNKKFPAQMFINSYIIVEL